MLSFISQNSVFSFQGFLLYLVRCISCLSRNLYLCIIFVYLVSVVDWDVSVYLPSCILQGSSRAHYVMSPYLYLSNFLKSCMLAASTISSLSPFHTSTVLCGKLYFMTSLEHECHECVCVCVCHLSYQLIWHRKWGFLRDPYCETGDLFSSMGFFLCGNSKFHLISPLFCVVDCTSVYVVTIFYQVKHHA